jgi:hypothetical protein
MLFPFVLDFYIKNYVAEEKPYIINKHYEYLLKTQDPISMNDFLVEHYCNEKSVWYAAEQFHLDNNPLNQNDGTINNHKYRTLSDAD